MYVEVGGGRSLPKTAQSRVGSRFFLLSRRQQNKDTEMGIGVAQRKVAFWKSKRERTFEWCWINYFA